MFFKPVHTDRIFYARLYTPFPAHSHPSPVYRLKESSIRVWCAENHCGTLQKIAITRFSTPVSSLPSPVSGHPFLRACQRLMALGTTLKQPALPLAAKNTPPLAAFAGLKTHTQYVTLSLG
jgi:hypothetical protein